MRGPKLYLRGGTWWCRVRDKRGRIVRRSTHCRDYAAACIEVANLERLAVDSTYAAATEARLDEAIDDYLKDHDRRGSADATKKIARQKCGHFVRLWKPDLPMSAIDARLVTDYIDQRLKEGVVAYTVKKELNHLGQVLLLARHHGTFHLDIERVMPPFFEGGYRPKKRTPSPAELTAVLAQFPARRGAHLAFFAATGARLGESARARRGDVSKRTGLVYLRGTKTEGSDRTVPITPLVATLLDWSLDHAPGADVLFHPWGKLHRDLAAACVRAELPAFTPNDLRRSFTTWHREAGIKPDLLAAMLGHTTDKLVQTTYGKLQPGALRDLLSEQLKSVPSLYQSTGETDSNVNQREDDLPGNDARPARLERATNGLEGRPHSARSAGTILGIRRARAASIVPNLDGDVSREIDGARRAFRAAAGSWFADAARGRRAGGAT